MNKQTYTKQLEYIDTLGVWPIYIRGALAVTLVGKPHTISVEDAREVVAHMLRR